MDDLTLIVIGIGLFFFGYEIRPYIVKKYPEQQHFVDLMVMALTITTFLVPLISLIAKGEIVIGSYIIIVGIFVTYFVYYFFTHKNELKGKSRKAFVTYIGMYTYIFLASTILLVGLAPYISNIKL